MRTKGVIHSQKGVFNVVTVNPLWIGRVKDIGTINDEFVTIQALCKFNIDGPNAVGEVHLKRCILVPLAYQLDGLCRTVVCQSGCGCRPPFCGLDIVGHQGCSEDGDEQENYQDVKVLHESDLLVVVGSQQGVGRFNEIVKVTT